MLNQFARSLVLTVAAGGIAAAGGAQNLLTNGSFHSDISGWTVVATGTGTAAFVPLDAEGSASSGSMQTVNTSSAAGQSYNYTQCHVAIAGASYDFAGKVRVPPGQPAGTFSLLLNYYANATCSGSGIGTADGSSRLDFTPSGAWQGLSRTGLPAPVGTLSVSITLGNVKTGAGSATTAFFDDIVLAATGTLRATLTIPVAASIHGANGTFFHTDLWVLARSFTNSVTVTAVYRCFGVSSCGAARMITLAPRETRLISDVIGTLFGMPESGGAIELSWDTFNGALTARTRLYTPSAPPSYGFGVAGEASTAATARAVFIGVAGSPDLSKGFRSNAGAYNPNPTPVTVILTLYDGATGSQLGSPLIRVWAPFEAAQVSNVLASLGAGSVTTTNAVLTATAIGGNVFFYAVTIDNLSGDGVNIGASADEFPVP
jgi:hypothetical protein